MTEIVRGRYAPSPTGTLHMGNLRTALLAWLFARSARGEFILRIEDLDQPRMQPHATQQMLQDLRWLGLDWDEGPEGGPYAPYIQNERLEIYQWYLQRLRDAGLVYPCYCSRAEIQQAAAHLPPGVDGGARYPGTCRQLSEQQRRQYERQGRRPSLRLRVRDDTTITFTDLVLGPQQQQVQQAIGDFILRRADGIFAYQLAVVVDDALMRLNQIVRGADLLSSTARQIILYQLFGFPIPTFAHVPLIHNEQGQKLSKRIQSAGLAPLRTSNYTAEDVIGLLAHSCGLRDTAEAISAIELAAYYRQQPATSLYERLRPGPHTA
ncbi:tRNA glutamyl-Q(34) synthetase GluQRS [Dictyobacter aurantiacus]|uniref:Glutamyl-Q tRNA(Asp) synthetase n=1 Tax=Dictyobacter aurantiacus TaxID=1936993 RepID=A0A401ZHT2_9CHLR|nr:tRNA glutamyl-Q(34) synthetase GluQRS [Dictyobacter aurantiacus]GCE06288.1 glutamyl-Q tRNA(Asp) synthetase [Dictyobacter aurantiacus]